MSTCLQRFLENITAVPDRIDRYCDEALNSLPTPPAILTEWDQYRALMARLYCILECRILGIRSRTPDLQFDLYRCWALLKKKFGESAPQAGFEIARTGAEGGVRKLLRTVAELYSRKYAEHLISMAVEAYCSNRSPQELLADAEEYMAQHKHIVPTEISEGTGVRIQANFRKVLKQHPFVVRRLRVF